MPKLRVAAENVYNATPIERWAYFLKNADKLTPEDVRRMFPDREIVEAAGVLEMISQTPEQRQLYDARLKYQRDEAARLEKARDEGELKGELIGRIRTLEEYFGITQSRRDELLRMKESQLSELAQQLQDRLYGCGSALRTEISRNTQD